MCVSVAELWGHKGAPGSGRWAEPGFWAVTLVLWAQSPSVARGSLTIGKSGDASPAMVRPGPPKGFIRAHALCPPTPVQPPPSPAPHSGSSRPPQDLCLCQPAAWVPFPLLLALLTSAEVLLSEGPIPRARGDGEVVWCSLPPQLPVRPTREGLYGLPFPQHIHGVKEVLGQVCSSQVVREGAPRGCGSVKAAAEPRPLLGVFLRKAPAFGLCPVTLSAAMTAGVELVMGPVTS